MRHYYNDNDPKACAWLRSGATIASSVLLAQPFRRRNDR
jgi:hypothetical protein